MATIDEVVAGAITAFTLIGSVLGTIALLRQIWADLVKKREVLSRTVLRPWSDAKIHFLWRGPNANAFTLVIPKESVPSEVTPNPPSDGLEVWSLPALKEGVRFLRGKRPTLYSKWKEIERLRGEFDDLGKQRFDILEKMVRADMARHYTWLRPVEEGEYGSNQIDVYVVEGLVWKAETEGYNRALSGRRESIPINATATASGDKTWFEISGGRTILRASSADKANSGMLRGLLDKWIGRSTVVRLNERMVQRQKDVERVLSVFCSDLKEVIALMALGEL